MTTGEIKDKVIKGGIIAIERLIERKRKEDGYIVVFENGKVKKLYARDIPPKS